MSFKSLLKKIIPSLHAQETLHGELMGLRDKIDELQIELRRKNELLFFLSQNLSFESLEDTKKRVFQNIPKATGELRSLQLAENYILQRVKGVCDENGICFWLAGGTLLGAVRHHGFIPWDNDIDIYMMRCDALKLIELLKTDEEIRAHTYYTSNGNRIMKIKYVFSEEIYIDVFTFDYFECNDAVEAKKLWDNTQEVSSNFVEQVKELIDHTEPINEGKYMRPVMIEAVDPGMETIYNRCVEHLPYYGHDGNYLCESIYDGPFFRTPGGYFPTCEAFPMIRDAVEFEGKRYDALANYMDRLAFQYGDIWSFPSTIDVKHSGEYTVGLKDALNELRIRHILQ